MVFSVTYKVNKPWVGRILFSLGLVSSLALSFHRANLRVFLRSLLIPSSRLLCDRFVVEDEDFPSYYSFGLVLGWIGRDFGDASHDFVPPSHFHELDSMTIYGMVYVSTHDLFVSDLYLFWSMMNHRGRYFDTMLGWFHWSYDYT
jgi:hypothetical protein